MTAPTLARLLARRQGPADAIRDELRGTAGGGCGCGGPGTTRWRRDRCGGDGGVKVDPLATLTDDGGISAASLAVDEIFLLRAVLADEAAITEAHLGYKTFPKTRRKYAEEQVERMRRFAAGELYAATREKFDQQRALRTAGLEETLTNARWAEQRGLWTPEQKS